MPTASLPDNPNLKQLKDNAKTLRDLVRASLEPPLDLVREHHPRFGSIEAGSIEAAAFKLSDAQLTVARHYGFQSWPRLKAHVEEVNRLSRSPHLEAIGGDLATEADRVDELLRLACLNYGNDDPARWRAAVDLLAGHPELGSYSLHTAGAVGDLARAQRLIAEDPGSVNREGGPFRWPPLMYLTYSRLDADGDAVAVARLLLDHGADPNAGYLWEGLPSPFTALTGVFGRGEQAAPPHSRSLELARLLLQAGAEANDSQIIYNCGLGAEATDDTDGLALLLEFGLGRGDGGPWRKRLMEAHQTPTEIAAEALQNAVENGLLERTRLLLDHGIDPNVGGAHPNYGGRSPYEGAVLHGNLDIAALLAAAGADTALADPTSLFIGYCLAADRPSVNEAIEADPTLLPRALEDRSDLIARATELDRADAIALLLDLGFDINHRQRTTALHEAAWRGNLPLVKLLVELGADPQIVDESHDSTPRGWAEHNDRPEVVAYLDGLEDR